jgi:hypothetical protein
MYKLPTDFDGAFFLGKTLEFVTFSENTVSLIFNESVSITVESCLEHRGEPDLPPPVIQKVPVSESRLMQLLGHSIRRATGDEKGTLEVVFDNGHVVRIYDDPPCYESYSIFNGEQRIIV